MELTRAKSTDCLLKTAPLNFLFEINEFDDATEDEKSAERDKIWTPKTSCSSLQCFPETPLTAMDAKIS